MIITGMYRNSLMSKGLLLIYVLRTLVCRGIIPRPTHLLHSWEKNIHFNSILGANLREVNKGNKVSPKFFMTCVQSFINSYLCMDKIGTRPRRASIQANFEEDILNELWSEE